MMLISILNTIRRNLDQLEEKLEDKLIERLFDSKQFFFPTGNQTLDNFSLTLERLTGRPIALNRPLNRPH